MTTDVEESGEATIEWARRRRRSGLEEEDDDDDNDDDYDVRNVKTSQYRLLLDF